MMKHGVFGFLFLGLFAGSFARADDAVFRGTWNVDGTNLVCTVWNCSTNRCLLPFSRSGDWFGWLKVEYRLSELDFPGIQETELADAWCSDGTGMVICSPHDPDIVLVPLNPSGNASISTNECIVKRFPLNPVAVKSATRQLQAPDDASLFVARLKTLYLFSTAETKEELDPEDYWDIGTISLQPSAGGIKEATPTKNDGDLNQSDTEAGSVGKGG